jgi:uncharacterized protein YggU (UPF0235/DUF167 family)
VSAPELSLLAMKPIHLGLPWGQHPTLLEWVGIFMLVVLLTATIFGLAAKWLTRSDPYDPMARFYRVFWRSMFRISVPPPASLAAGATQATTFKVDAPAPTTMDAPDLDRLGSLDGLAALESGALGGSEAEAAATSAAGISTRRPAASVARDDDIIQIPGSKEPPRKQASLDVRVIALADDNAVGRMVGGELEIRVTKPADDWQINGVVLELVARKLDIQAYQVTLLKGHNRVRKTLQIAGLDAAEIVSRLGE